jgi:hypothetical protein
MKKTVNILPVFGNGQCLVRRMALYATGGGVTCTFSTSYSSDILHTVFNRTGFDSGAVFLLKKRKKTIL